MNYTIGTVRQIGVTSQTVAHRPFDVDGPEAHIVTKADGVEPASAALFANPSFGHVPEHCDLFGGEQSGRRLFLNTIARLRRQQPDQHPRE
jgi:hypothetical protein